MSWIIKADGSKLCDRHNVTFSKRDVCSHCITDPGAATETEIAESNDQGALEDEQWFRDKADQLWGFVEKMCGSASDEKKKNRVEYSTIAKVADTACKFMRAAVEERRRRDEHRHDRWLVKQCRELARRGVTN